MRKASAEFFDHLGRFGHEMLPDRVTGTIRIDLERAGETDCWLLDLKGGRVGVSREKRPADCVIRVEEGMFDRLATGETNMVAAVVRCELSVEGDIPLFMILQRFTPGPPGAHDSRVRGR